MLNILFINNLKFIYIIISFAVEVPTCIIRGFCFNNFNFDCIKINKLWLITNYIYIYIYIYIYLNLYSINFILNKWRRDVF